MYHYLLTHLHILLVKTSYIFNYYNFHLNYGI